MGGLREKEQGRAGGLVGWMGLAAGLPPFNHQNKSSLSLRFTYITVPPSQDWSL